MASDNNLVCKECGKLFTEANQKLRTSKDYNLTAEGPLCCARSACRARVLRTVYEERGLKQWARETKESLLSLMDPPPAKCDRTKPWVSVHLPHVRVLAAIKFYSICWPVCLLYAVQTDADGEPIKEFGEWKRHTHRSLAAVLHMKQPLVTRAIAYLNARHLLVDMDDDRLYPDLAPKSLKSGERDNCIVITDAILKDLAALPIKAFKTIQLLRPLLSPEDCTVIEEVAADACTELNQAISDARTRATERVLDACKRHLSLLSRSRETETSPSSSSASPFPPQWNPDEASDDDDGTRKELYAAAAEHVPSVGVLADDDPAHGKGAFAKLPRPRPAEERVARELQLDDKAAELLMKKCRTVEPTITSAEVIELAFLKLEQLKVGIQKGNINNIPGMLIRSVPSMCSGAVLEAARERLAEANRQRAARVAWIRENWPEYSDEERAEAIRQFPELGDDAAAAGGGERREA